MTPTAALVEPAASSDEPRRDGRIRRWAYLFVFVFSLIYPSTAIFKKAGYGALTLYVIGAAVFFLWAITKFIPWLLARRVPSWVYATAAAAMIVGVLSMYLYVHPRIDTTGFRIGSVVVGASDNDDAIDLAIGELRAGRYPYYVRTFLNLSLSPMPGMLLLALPFYAVGDSALQNVFWTVMFFWFIGRYMRSWRMAVVLAALMLVASPVILYQIAQGIDYGANSVYLLIFSALLLERARRDGRASAAAILWAALLGIGLSSRMNFVLLIPFVFVALLQATSRRTAVQLTLIVLIVLAAVTLPFFLYDPAGFSPLSTFRFLEGKGKLPWARFVVPVIAGVLCAALLWRRRMKCDIATLARDMTVVMAFLMVTSLMIQSYGAGKAFLGIIHMGVMFLFLGVFGYGTELLKPMTTREV